MSTNYLDQLSARVRARIFALGLEKELPKLHEALLAEDACLNLSEKKLRERQGVGFTQGSHLPSRTVTGLYGTYLERPFRITADPYLIEPAQVELMKTVVASLEAVFWALREMYLQEPRTFIPYIGQSASLENVDWRPPENRCIFPWGKLDVYWIEQDGRLWPQILDISSQCVSPFAFSAADKIYRQMIGHPLRRSLEPELPFDWAGYSLRNIEKLAENLLLEYHDWCRNMDRPEMNNPVIAQIVGEGNHGRAEHRILNRMLTRLHGGQTATIIHYRDLELDPQTGQLMVNVRGHSIKIDLAIRACVNRQAYHPDFPEKAAEAEAMALLTEAQLRGRTCVVPAIGNRLFDSKGWAYVLRAKRFQSKIEEALGLNRVMLKIVQSAFPECARLSSNPLQLEREDGSILPVAQMAKVELRNWVNKANDTSGSRGVDIPSKGDSLGYRLRSLEEIATSPSGAMSERFVPPQTGTVITYTADGIKELPVRQKDCIYISRGQLVGWCTLNEETLKTHYLHGGEASSISLPAVCRNI